MGLSLHVLSFKKRKLHIYTKLVLETLPFAPHWRDEKFKQESDFTCSHTLLCFNTRGKFRGFGGRVEGVNAESQEENK